MLANGLDKTFGTFTKKITFTDDKVIRVAFVICLICGITMGAAALIVNYPVITSGFFSVLTVAGSVSLLAMAIQGIRIAKQKRAEAKASKPQYAKQ